jgi:hypothetical protein
MVRVDKESRKDEVETGIESGWKKRGVKITFRKINFTHNRFRTGDKKRHVGSHDRVLGPKSSNLRRVIIKFGVN